MAVSEKRIDELLDHMLNNADEDGWCYIPEGLTEEESNELTKRLTIITMQDRIDAIMESILDTLKYLLDIQKKIDEYDTMDKLKLIGALDVLKEDSQTILIDLHSENKLGDFFKIDVIITENENANEEAENAISLMNELTETVFKESLDKIKGYCESMITMSEELMVSLKEKK